MAENKVPNLKLTLQHRSPDVDQQTVVEEADFEPERTALLLCDVWNEHWCKGATARVNELAPVINGVVRQARDRGLLIVHSPSGTLSFYEGTPARENAKKSPHVAAPEWIGNWEHLDPARESPLPIDDSDGGCDCEPTCPGGGPWTRQHVAIEIADNDVLTDNGQEFYNLLAERGIENVLVAGVHTNMCVLGRPFGIRRLVRLGKRVALLRDLTDTMYNSRMPPYVNHHEGTARVIAHIERWWCPTLLSSDITGQEPFRFADLV